MVVYAPWQLEMLGAGDIAAPPPMDAISRLYGFIPVNRGNLDRAAPTKALSVLQQGGILGLFPEGGIWDPGAMEAKRGVAWLSYQSRAPILPIGFGSPDGALRDTLRLKRPALSMTVGKLIPPVDLPKGSPRHEALQRAAVDILDAVDRLIPKPFRQQRMAIADERFELGLRVLTAAGQPLTIPLSSPSSIRTAVQGLLPPWPSYGSLPRICICQWLPYSILTRILRRRPSSLH